MNNKNNMSILNDENSHEFAFFLNSSNQTQRKNNFLQTNFSFSSNSNTDNNPEFDDDFEIDGRNLDAFIQSTDDNNIDKEYQQMYDEPEGLNWQQESNEHKSNIYIDDGDSSQSFDPSKKSQDESENLKVIQQDFDEDQSLGENWNSSSVES